MPSPAENKGFQQGAPNWALLKTSSVLPEPLIRDFPKSFPDRKALLSSLPNRDLVIATERSSLQSSSLRGSERLSRHVRWVRRTRTIVGRCRARSRSTVTRFIQCSSFYHLDCCRPPSLRTSSTTSLRILPRAGLRFGSWSLGC